MKKLISLLALFIVVIGMRAQLPTTLVATLLHDGEIKSYYGPSAFQQANAAAVDGDIVTLSPGEFLSCNLDKAITIKGAGCSHETTPGGTPTIIVNDFNITADPGENGEILRIECINFISDVKADYKDGGISNVVFVRCQLTKFNTNFHNSIGTVATFIGCRITSSVNLTNYTKTEFYNSIINNVTSNSAVEALTMRNCVLKPNISSVTSLENGLISNSFIIWDNYNIPSSNTLFNCVVFTDAASIFSSIDDNGTNRQMPTESMNEIFESFDPTLQDHVSLYQIKEDKKQDFMVISADDVDEIGLYGGVLPFDTTPTNLHVTKFEVAPKSSADGTLNVIIQVGN